MNQLQQIIIKRQQIDNTPHHISTHIYTDIYKVYTFLRQKFFKHTLKQKRNIMDTLSTLRSGLKVNTQTFYGKVPDYYLFNTQKTNKLSFFFADNCKGFSFAFVFFYFFLPYSLLWDFWNLIFKIFELIQKKLISTVSNWLKDLSTNWNVNEKTNFNYAILLGTVLRAALAGQWKHLLLPDIDRD